jgi:hypothetical protein
MGADIGGRIGEGMGVEVDDFIWRHKDTSFRKGLFTVVALQNHRNQKTQGT